jgi:hypothetical protein
MTFGLDNAQIVDSPCGVDGCHPNKLHLSVKQDPAGTWKNAQVYMCGDGKCTGDDWADAIRNQKSLSFGKFSFLVEKGHEDANLVLGLYTYKPNMLQCDKSKDAAAIEAIEDVCQCSNACDGNVDTSNEVDIEYANWDNTSTSLWFTPWPQQPSGYSTARRATPVKTGIESLVGPRCNYFDWAATSITFATWNVSASLAKDFSKQPPDACSSPPAPCTPPSCVQSVFDQNVSFIPQLPEIVGLNLWIRPGQHAPRNGQNHEIIISHFMYESTATSDDQELEEERSFRTGAVVGTTLLLVAVVAACVLHRNAGPQSPDPAHELQKKDGDYALMGDALMGDALMGDNGQKERASEYPAGNNL